VRAVALVSGGSAAIHQARYALGGGSPAAAHGHGYLAVAVPLVIAALVFVMAGILLRIARGRPARSDASLPALWLGATIALAVIFGLQESIEGTSALTGGGWIGLALAAPAGLLIALALRGASAAESAPGPGVRLGFHVFLDARAIPVPRPLAGRLAASACSARAPPLASVV
jgi:hypothetical protein